jgi:hypothetical protein
MSALHLGDMAFLSTQIDWTRQLIANYDLGPDWLQHYLDAYYEAAGKHLNADGRPIIEWLDQVRRDQPR